MISNVEGTETKFENSSVIINDSIIRQNYFNFEK